MMIASSVKGKQQPKAMRATPAPNSKAVKHLIIKVLVFVAAFFIGGSIVSLIVGELVPALFPSKNTNEQGHILAYMIIVFYPLAGASAVYLTNKWLKRKLR